MDIIRKMDMIAKCYPILDIITVQGVSLKQLLNFEDVYERIKIMDMDNYRVISCYREIATNNVYMFKEILLDETTNIHLIQEEINILSKISKDNKCVSKYYDSFIYTEDTNIIFVIVTEYIYGYTLQTYINTLLKLDIKAQHQTIFNFSIWLFTTLAHLHNMGYIHGNINPNNIMIDIIDDRFVLMDFGLACSIKEHNEGSSRIINNSFEYTPPEKLFIPSSGSLFKIKFRRNNIDLSKLDIWAAGITIYYMVERRFPWDVTDVEHLFDNIRKEKIKYNYHVSEVIEIIRSILIRNPDNRLSAIEIVNKIQDIIQSYNKSGYKFPKNITYKSADNYKLKLAKLGSDELVIDEIHRISSSGEYSSISSPRTYTQNNLKSFSR
jgi:serine/threonine protein kinase